MGQPHVCAKAENERTIVDCPLATCITGGVGTLILCVYIYTYSVITWQKTQNKRSPMKLHQKNDESNFVHLGILTYTSHHKSLAERLCAIGSNRCSLDCFFIVIVYCIWLVVLRYVVVPNWSKLTIISCNSYIFLPIIMIQIDIGTGSKHQEAPSAPLEDEK